LKVKKLLEIQSVIESRAVPSDMTENLNIGQEAKVSG